METPRCYRTLPMARRRVLDTVVIAARAEAASRGSSRWRIKPGFARIATKNSTPCWIWTSTWPWTTKKIKPMRSRIQCPQTRPRIEPGSESPAASMAGQMPHSVSETLGWATRGSAQPGLRSFHAGRSARFGKWRAPPHNGRRAIRRIRGSDPRQTSERLDLAHGA